MTTTKMSKADMAYAWIRQHIISGELNPGDRLTLPTIAEALEISVVPVREAVRRLEAEGLATFERNIGARVARIDEKSYRDSMETLAYLEGVATGLAAPYLSVDDLLKADAINQQMKELITDLDPVKFTHKNQEFHLVLFDRCPNRRIVELVHAEWSRLRNLRASTFSFVPERAHESVKEHEQILNALQPATSKDTVEKVAREHVLATLEHFLSHQEAKTSLRYNKGVCS